MHERTTGAGLKAAIAMALLSAACERDPNAVAPRHLTSFVAASSTSLIAFTSERDGNKEIYVMNADGTGQTRLTENPAADFEPTWSPDRTRLAFASNRDGNNEIYVMNADGTGQTRLTNNTAYARHPAWCGHRIAFESNQYGGFPDVYVMNDDGTGQTRLTIGNADFDESPAWSPGCDRIAYTSDPGGHRHIFVMNADGTGRIQLTNGAYAERYPAWSPDGNRIAFVSEPSDPDWQLYVMNADGSGQTSLTDKVGYNGYPAWSPDGFQIAFPTNRDGNYEIYIVNADGTNQTRLTDNPTSDLNPAWFVAAPTGNQPPVASFTYSCSGEACDFTSTSSDFDSITYSWTFGDGGTATAQNPSHSYTAGGTYTVTLTVTDNQGGTSSFTHYVRVTVTGPNQPPVASFTWNCTGLTCTFTSTSSDPDGSITTYSVTLGDGGGNGGAGGGAGPLTTHGYAASGTYTVTLTVTDNQGATSSVSHNVTVSAANQPPLANFTFRCNQLSCDFTDTSTDPDGSVVAWHWTGSDGATSAGQNPSYTFPAAGSYTVTLTVTDNQGATSATASKTVTVTTTNQAPTANFTFRCNQLSCDFTDTSTDPDGSVVAWRWTSSDGATSTDESPSYTFPAGGSYTVTMSVTDNQGATSASTRQTVTVTP